MSVWGWRWFSCLARAVSNRANTPPELAAVAKVLNVKCESLPSVGNPRVGRNEKVEKMEDPLRSQLVARESDAFMRHANRRSSVCSVPSNWE